MRKLFAMLCLLLATPCLAGTIKVEGVRLWAAPERTRVVFDVQKPVEHTIFTLSNPNRIVIDLEDAEMEAANVPDGDGLVARIRSAPRKGHDLRVVLDLKEAATPRSFLVRPNENYGNRLVVDLYPRDTHKEKNEPVVSVPAQSGRPRNLIVAIDAGHGGEDPGAHGPHGTLEKNVTLKIARRLADMVKSAPGLTPVLIRNGDYYISLRGRIEKAREHKADMFVSIHADAFRDPSAGGSSVYALSQRGASDEAARWLAERENASDLIGGVSLEDKDDLVASVLLDLSQTGTIAASLRVGKRVLHQLSRVGRIHKNHVMQAGFAVLKSPDIPSILVETAFISNPREERKLANPAHQRDIASAVLAGVQNYFLDNPPPGTLVAQIARGDGKGMLKHVIARGDTLTGIAQEYNVSLQSLRRANQIEGDMLRAGDVLYIPLHHQS